jgi:predicted nuclease with TOPRIM domain
LISILWNIFFGYGKLNGRIDAQQEDIQEIKANALRLEEKMDRGFEKMNEKMDQGFSRLENKIDNLASELHKMDIRVTKLEVKKP